MLAFKRKSLIFLGLCCLLFCICPQVFSQSQIVNGTVVDAADNKPVSGVSVVDQKTNIGTSTDPKGAFSLLVSSTKAVLLFSSVGYETYSYISNGSSSITIKLTQTSSALQDVVVVGYGVQKKVNQTGSTQTVKFSDAVNQPVTNTGQLMYGKFSGVQITQGSGLPGADASSVLIRGLGTFGSSSPLVVIDNIQFSGLNEFNNLSPADIESISVLKDASASAIYGARGANGVIIVTTKKGVSGAGSVVYNSYFGFQEATVVPTYLGALDYATLINERDINQTGPTTNVRYSLSDLQAISDGSRPDQFANTNWAKEILRRAPMQSQYLAFSGGNDKTTYRVSVGYLSQEAIVKGEFKSDRFNLSFNLNSNVKSWLTINNVTNAYWSKFKGPTGGTDAITGETGIINQFQRSHPLVPALYSNGEYGFVDGSYLKANASPPITNPLRRGVLGDFSDDEINIADRFGIKANILKGLSFETSGSISALFGSTSNFNPTSDVRDWVGNIVSQNLVNSLRNSTRFNYRLLNENIIRYSKKFRGRHDVSLLAGHSLVYNRNDGFTGNLEGFPTNNLQEFNGGGVLNPNVSGGASVETLQSFFGRVNYILDGKYLFEANVRRDGSSKFGPENKYGTFPSLSAGWRISEEKFLRNVKWISELKLRGSWGITGNDNIGNNLYSQNYSLSGDYFIGNTIVTAVALTGGLANPRIRWEKVEQLDLGIDAAFFRNKLQVTAGYFKRNSSDLLYSNYPIPATIGLSSLGAQNAADMVNAGTEFSVSYKNSVKKFNYTLGANLSLFEDNKVTGLGQGGLETIGAETIIRVGVPFNALFGYRVLGVFQTTDEVIKSPRQFGNTRTAPGDFKYEDLNSDGVINESDRTVIGNPFPKTVYNFNGIVDYKGVDLAVTFEGVGKLERVLNDNGQRVFEDSRNNVLSYLIDRWTPTNPSTKYPRAGGQNNAVISTFFVEDVSYTRLRNVELGYTFPNKLTGKFGVSKLRLYLGGQNLLTFTKFKNFDPERQRGGNTDQNTPLYKVYTFGLNVKF